MRYERFLKEEYLYDDVRSRPISEDDVKKGLLGAYNKSFKVAGYFEPSLLKKNKGTVIYRGTNHLEEFLQADPRSSGKRVSANTQNYYTLITDHDSKWKSYPNRSDSLICTTSRSNAESYGEPYLVFPINGAKIGVCPAIDFWVSFKKTGVLSLDTFNKVLEDMFLKIGIDLTENDYSALMNDFKEFDDELSDEDDFWAEWESSKFVNTTKWFGKYIEYNNMKKFTSDLLDPRKNGFKIVKAGDSIQDKYREVWTDAKCIMLLDDEENRKLLNKWAKEL